MCVSTGAIEACFSAVPNRFRRASVYAFVPFVQFPVTVTKSASGVATAPVAASSLLLNAAVIASIACRIARSSP